MAFEEQDMAGAVSFFKRAALEGDALGQFNLAVCYEQGQKAVYKETETTCAGVEQDNS